MFAQCVIGLFVLGAVARFSDLYVAHQSCSSTKKLSGLQTTMRCCISIDNLVGAVAFSKFHKTKKQKIFSSNFNSVKFALPTHSNGEDTRIPRF